MLNESNIRKLNKNSILTRGKTLFKNTPKSAFDKLKPMFMILKMSLPTKKKYNIYNMKYLLLFKIMRDCFCSTL